MSRVSVTEADCLRALPGRLPKKAAYVCDTLHCRLIASTVVPGYVQHSGSTSLSIDPL